MDGEGRVYAVHDLGLRSAHIFRVIPRTHNSQRGGKVALDLSAALHQSLQHLPTAGRSPNSYDFELHVYN